MEETTCQTDYVTAVQECSHRHKCFRAYPENAAVERDTSYAVGMDWHGNIRWTNHLMSIL